MDPYLISKRVFIDILIEQDIIYNQLPLEQPISPIAVNEEVTVCTSSAACILVPGYGHADSTLNESDLLSSTSIEIWAILWISFLLLCMYVVLFLTMMAGETCICFAETLTRKCHCWPTIVLLATLRSVIVAEFNLDSILEFNQELYNGRGRTYVYSPHGIAWFLAFTEGVSKTWDRTGHWLDVTGWNTCMEGAVDTFKGGHLCEEQVDVVHHPRMKSQPGGYAINSIKKMQIKLKPSFLFLVETNDKITKRFRPCKVTRITSAWHLSFFVILVVLFWSG